MKRCLSCQKGFTARSWECPACGFAPAVESGIPVLAPELAREIGGYDSALFETHGGEQAERSFWSAARAELIIWALATHAPGARRFLEIGCGTGGVLSRLEAAFPGLELTGAEALVDGLRMAGRRLKRTELLQFDATQVPFDGEFDAAGVFDVIEHIPADGAVLASLASALAPQGILVITVPQHPFLFGPADVAARHVRRYTAAGLAALVERAGLRVELATSFVTLLFPAMACTRLWSKWRGGAYDSADEFAIGFLNTVFARVMAIERWAIRRGARMPFGGSLLMVARKPA